MEKVKQCYRDPMDRRHLIVRYLGLEDNNELNNASLIPTEKSSMMFLDPMDNLSTHMKNLSMREKDESMALASSNVIRKTPKVSKMHNELFEEIDEKKILESHLGSRRSRFRSRNGNSPKIRIEANDENYEKLLTENTHLKDTVAQKNNDIQEIKKLLSGESKEQDVIKQKLQEIEILKRKLNDTKIEASVLRQKYETSQNMNEELQNQLSGLHKQNQPHFTTLGDSQVPPQLDFAPNMRNANEDNFNMPQNDDNYEAVKMLSENNRALLKEMAIMKTKMENQDHIIQKLRQDTKTNFDRENSIVNDTEASRVDMVRKLTQKDEEINSLKDENQKRIEDINMLSEKVHLLNDKIYEVNEKNEILMSNKAFAEGQMLQNSAKKDPQRTEMILRHSIKTNSPLSKQQIFVFWAAINPCQKPIYSRDSYNLRRG